MDRIAEYRNTVERVLRNHPGHPAGQTIETKLIADRQRDEYVLVDVGWDKSGKRVHCVFAHLRICDGKVWLEYDGTEKGFAVDLVEAGIPKEDIVLGFFRPERRQLTDFAVA